MPIKITPYEHEVFKRNFLRTVVCQIRVQPIFQIASETPTKDFISFQEKIRKNYPNVHGEESVQVQVKDQALEKKSLGKTWHFKSDDDCWKVVLDSAFIAVEARSYKSFKDFRVRFEEVYDAYLTVYEPSKPERIGLRYINMIRPVNAHTLADWVGWVKPELMGFVSTPEVELPLINDYKELRTVQNPGEMTIRHGLISDQDRSFVYLIDVDRYIMRAKNQQEVAALLNKFHEDCYNFFRWSINSKTVEWMKGS